MDDRSILSHINELVAEEKALRTRHVGDGLEDAERDRMHQLEIELDQAWDLLRQRRAKREFGHYLRLNFGHPGDERQDAAMETLGRLIAAQCA